MKYKNHKTITLILPRYDALFVLLNETARFVTSTRPFIYTTTNPAGDSAWRSSEGPHTVSYKHIGAVKHRTATSPSNVAFKLSHRECHMWMVIKVVLWLYVYGGNIVYGIILACATHSVWEVSYLTPSQPVVRRFLTSFGCDPHSSLGPCLTIHVSK